MTSGSCGAGVKEGGENGSSERDHRIDLGDSPHWFLSAAPICFLVRWINRHAEHESWRYHVEKKPWFMNMGSHLLVIYAVCWFHGQQPWFNHSETFCLAETCTKVETTDLQSIYCLFTCHKLANASSSQQLTSEVQSKKGQEDIKLSLQSAVGVELATDFWGRWRYKQRCDLLTWRG